MKAHSVHFEVVKSDNNYGNTKIGIVVELEPGERADDALKAARTWVGKQFPDSRRNGELEWARDVMANPIDYTGRQIERAQALIASADGEDDIPF